MPKKEIEGIDIAKILAQHTEVQEALPSKWKVGGEYGKGRRAHQIGTAVLTIGLKHSAGYVMLLRFDDGKTDSFNPHMLFPVTGEEEPKA